MDQSEYDFFCVLNDLVLLQFMILTPWGKRYIVDLHHRAMTMQPISIKQRMLALTISKKVNKRKKNRQLY